MIAAAILPSVTRHHLDPRPDFVARSIKTTPIKALAELIWNSLDADATEVRVTFEHSPLGALDAIEVHDNGLGMTNEQAVTGFRALGGSWKDIEKESRKHKRKLHGRQGRGRLLAFSLRGAQVTWQTVAEANGGREATTIRISAEDRDYVDVSEPKATTGTVGTLVRVDGISDVVRGVEGEAGWLDLVTELALYTEQYKPAVTVDGRALDAGPLQANRSEYTIDGIDLAEPPVLTIVEWSIEVPAAVIYLCGPGGIALDSVKAPKATSGLDYTAYLRWHGIEERSSDLALVESGHPVLSPIVDRAREQIVEHFHLRQRERQRTVIEDWQKEEVYPYLEPPTDRIEEAARDLFDVVAVAASTAVNSSEDKKSRRFALSLLRQAVEREPSAVEEILQEVLHLPADQIEDFRHLLRRTSLTSILRASRSITDRLDFLTALRVMVFDAEVKKKVLERSELHRILENETWVFGEQFSLTASDQGLTKALAEHIKLLGRDDLARPTEVLDAEGHRRVLDMMLARSVPHGRREHEHLVVELKAPSVVIGNKEITQIRNYALAVARDPRFDRLNAQWDFMIVSTDLDEFAWAEASQTGREPGLVWELDGIRVWARSWAEIVDAAEYRLNFVKERLGYSPTDELALDYLRRAHAEFVPARLRADEATA
jgi:hypothetical protein